MVGLCKLCQVLRVGGYLHSFDGLCETNVNLSGTVLVLFIEQVRKKEVLFLGKC